MKKNMGTALDTIQYNVILYNRNTMRDTMQRKNSVHICAWNFEKVTKPFLRDWMCNCWQEFFTTQENSVIWYEAASHLNNDIYLCHLLLMCCTLRCVVRTKCSVCKLYKTSIVLSLFFYVWRYENLTKYMHSNGTVNSLNVGVTYLEVVTKQLPLSNK